MKRIIISFIIILAFAVSVNAGTTATEAAAALCKRIMPEFADKIHFELIGNADGKDVFELESDNSGIVIRGNSANSMAVGLNHYLKYYCLTSVSWYKNDPIELPAKLPVLNEKVRREARVDNRFFLNYCTFGYTMPWWQWADWERFIDWMALQGINLPLAITGQEAVWDKVWQQLGLDKETIRAYFTGPAHLPWHRMSNLDYFQGGLPDYWLEHQADLQHKIVSRERELGMKPVLPAFAGHVPEALAKKFPDAKITRMSKWSGMDDSYRSHFLDPMDPLYAKIQKMFLEEQTKLYGTDHIYGVDPFNEVDPPSWDPEFLAYAGKHIYNTLSECDPDATWLQMTWLFYQAKKKWQPERVRAYITSIPTDHTLLLDYYCDRAEVWKETDSFFGQPYLWCYLGNFGGNTMMIGNLEETGSRIENAMTNGGDNFKGIGSTLEALDINPVMYEYVFEKAWSDMKPDREWVNAWADRRTGSKSEKMRSAWQGLIDNVYNTTARLGQASLTNSRPGLETNGTRWTKPTITYDNSTLFDIWTDMIAATDSSAARDSHRFDIVNTGRQVLGNHFLVLRNRFTDAYKAGEIEKARATGADMLALLDDIEELLSTHSTFLFGKWLDDAGSFGQNDAEKEYYRKNARTLLSVWGERDNYLNDYANRTWAGLINGYYKPRWQMFIDTVTEAMAKGKEFDADAFNNEVMDFEVRFADSPYSCPAVPAGDAVAIASRLAEKYANDIKK